MIKRLFFISFLLTDFLRCSVYSEENALQFSSSNQNIQTNIRFIKRVPKPAEMQSIDDIAYDLFEITFLRPNQKPIVTSYRRTEYDAWSEYELPPEGKPELQQLQKIYTDLTWSPEQKFVLLPGENWARAPGSTVCRSGINLSSSANWTIAPVCLDSIHFLDAYRAMGSQSSECAWSPAIFDGKTGVLRWIDQPKANRPEGDQVGISMDEKLSTKEKVIFRYTLKCDPAKVDPQNCIEFNPLTEKTKSISCP